MWRLKPRYLDWEEGWIETGMEPGATWAGD